MPHATQPLVSILTPVYNEEEYLPECIESVLAQTYQNWDYTIVDNCSKDKSVEIARRYAAKDSRIRIVQNQQFLRVVQNHNETLRQSSKASKYCKMVFSDDWMFPGCLEQMVAVAEEFPSVGVVAAYSLHGRSVISTGLPYQSKLVSGREICRRYLLERLCVFGSATAVLYRADLVRGHDPFYNEANFHADTEACFALLKTYDFGFVHQVLTFSRVRPGSLRTLSSDIGTRFPSMLHLIMKYGRDILSSEEFEACLDQHLSGYYKFLGRSVISRRDEEFWDYHKRRMIEAGVGLSRARVARMTLAELCGTVLNFKASIAIAKRMVRERLDGSRGSLQMNETRQDEKKSVKHRPNTAT
jgi:glycosyltransferase involved in cell wall biosynthesis